MSDEDPLAVDAAKDITIKIRNQLEGVWDLILTAYEGRAWEALGYDSWDAYCAAEFSGSHIKLTRQERTDIVVTLREGGMSQRAIASATGYDKRTVARDLEQKNFEEKSGEGNEPASTVVGVNGKKYRPRKKYTDSFWTTSYDLGKLGQRITKLADAGEFDQHRERIKEDSLPELLKVRDALDTVISRLKGACA